MRLYRSGRIFFFFLVVKYTIIACTCLTIKFHEMTNSIRYLTRSLTGVRTRFVDSRMKVALTRHRGCPIDTTTLACAQNIVRIAAFNHPREEAREGEERDIFFNIFSRWINSRRRWIKTGSHSARSTRRALSTFVFRNLRLWRQWKKEEEEEEEPPRRNKANSCREERLAPSFPPVLSFVPSSRYFRTYEPGETKNTRVAINLAMSCRRY